MSPRCFGAAASGSFRAVFQGVGSYERASRAMFRGDAQLRRAGRTPSGAHRKLQACAVACSAQGTGSPGVHSGWSDSVTWPWTRRLQQHLGPHKTLERFRLSASSELQHRVCVCGVFVLLDAQLLCICMRTCNAIAALCCNACVATLLASRGRLAHVWLRMVSMSMWLRAPDVHILPDQWNVTGLNACSMPAAPRGHQ